MLKRLLTAVLVLGLITAFGGTAFTAPNNVPNIPEGGRTPATRVAITGPEYRPLGYTSVNKVAIEGEPNLLTQHPVRPSGANVDTTECHIFGWADWVNASYFITFTRRSNTTSYNELAMRYDGPSLPNTAIKLYGAYNWIRRATDGDLLTGDGAVGIYVRVYDDVGGNPGALVHQELYSVPNIASTYDYTYFPFSAPVLLNGAYHISFSIDPAGPSTDTVVWTSDDAGFVSGSSVGTATITSRARVRTISDGLWKTMPTATGGTFDPAFDQLADYCQVYSNCQYHASPLVDVGLYTVPGPTGAWNGRRDGGAQRFSVVAPETLKTVTVYHYNLNVTYGGIFYTGASTNGINVMVFGDLAGNPDYASGPLATVTLPGGPSLFPITGLGTDGWNWIDVDFSSFNLVLTGPYHLAAQMTSCDPADGRLLFLWGDESGGDDHSGGSVDYCGGGAPWENTLTHPDWQAAVGGPEVGFLIEGVTCLDEFASCTTPASYQGFGTTGFLYMDNCNDPIHYGSRNGIAGRIVGETINRVEKVRFQIWDETWDGYPNINSKLKVSICAVTANNVGAELWTDTLDEALGELVMYPGWTEVVIPGGVIAINEFFVTLEPVLQYDGDTEWMYFGRERQSAIPALTLKNGGMHVKLCADNLWYNNNALIPGVIDNATIEADICSVPPSRWTCATPSDFMHAGADYGRTLHTNVALDDAYCDLTFKWKYEDPLYNVATNRIVNSGPVVFDTIVACGFSSRYRFFNLKDGSIIGEIAGPLAPYYLPTTGINCTPTIAMVDVGGTPKPIMFVGHGNSSGFRVFDAYDLSSWSGTAPTAVPAQLWSINQTNYAAKGFTFPSGYSSHIGATNYTNPIVMDLGGTECVIFNTNDQYIWAAEAATGMRYTGWTGPIIVNGLTYKGLATDGTNLYITNTALLPVYPLGDITCWDAATGTAIWSLSTAGGLQGASVMPDFGNETFVSGLALYQDKEIYAVSSTPEVDDPSGQYGGLLYRIKASDGSVLSTTPTEHRRQDGGLSLIGGIMVDATTIVVPGSSRWANSVNGGQLFGYNRFTGGQNWVKSEGAFDADAGHVHDGLLTCEAGDTDLGFITNTNGYLSCFDPITGDEYFSRRWNNPANVGGAMAISAGGELLVADRQGGLYCLSKTMADGVTPVADRPRLEILDHTPQGNTYGPLPSVIVTIPDVYYNSGCAPLTGTVTFSTTSNGSTLGPVAGTGVRSMDIADRLTQGSSKLMLMSRPDPSTEEYATSMAFRPSVNRAALAVPDFFNVGSIPVNLNPGDTGDFVIDVKQSMVFRGENVFFAYFQTNDPDYFLDSLILEPQVRGQIVGGCLLDTARLFFGSGGTNWQDVLNVPRYGHYGDVDNWYMEIEGDQDDFYGGFEVYGVSKERIAMNTQDWWTGNGEARAYKALQGDPNQCNMNCKPALLSAQTFGMITADGSAYTPLVGNMVCATFLDSVQMWAPLDSLGNYGTWNWNTTWLTAGTYNNDSTMGLITQRRSIGFTGFPTGMDYLGQVVVDFNKIYFRYPSVNGPLNGWRAGEHIDYDIGQDTILHFPTFAAYSACASVAALPGTRTTGTWGTLKIPYGGGCNSVTYPTLVNAISMEGNQSMNEQTQRGNAYLDSVYTLMGRPAGTYSQGPMRTAPGDQRSHDTWIHHDFADNADTLSFAIAHFGAPTLANPYDVNSLVAPLSKTLNKWVGMDRGDVNNDGALNLADIVYLADYVGTGAFGPIPFATVGDVNADDATDVDDVNYLVNYYFFYGDCPMSKYVEPFTW